MKKLLLIVMALAGLLISSPALAKNDSDWITIQAAAPNTTGVEARGADIFSGRSWKTDNKVWLRFDFSRDRTVEWRSAMVLYVIDCVNQSYKIASRTVYYPDGRNEYMGGDGRTMEIVPETNMALIARMVCVDIPAE